MSSESHVWVIVLAAGEGRRLSALTTDVRGVSVPKQFCSFGRSRPMLHWALDRAKALVPAERIVTVVAREHRPFWENALDGLPPENIIVQPRNRGTAAGILLPLMSVLRRDPEATVVVMPSDHYVAEEETLCCSLERAVVEAALHPDRLVLLGITPDEAETEYGWILAKAREGAEGAVRGVERFVEKPTRTLAAELRLEGAVWNSFIFAVSGRTLLHFYSEVLPDLLDDFLRDLVVVPRPGALEELYELLPSKDFSKELLQRLAPRLAVVVVPPCGWSDLGTPARLERFLRADRTERPVALSA
jgi:mannose-1-phosphate guanylyltransferase